MPKVTIAYAKSSKKIKIDANSTDFYPMYLKYLLIYLKLPTNATLVFNDTTIPGGVEAWLAKSNL